MYVPIGPFEWRLTGRYYMQNHVSFWPADRRTAGLLGADQGQAVQDLHLSTASRSACSTRADPKLGDMTPSSSRRVLAHSLRGLRNLEVAAAATSGSARASSSSRTATTSTAESRTPPSATAEVGGPHASMAAMSGSSDHEPRLSSSSTSRPCPIRSCTRRRRWQPSGTEKPFPPLYAHQPDRHRRAVARRDFTPSSASASSASTTTSPACSPTSRRSSSSGGRTWSPTTGAASTCRCIMLRCLRHGVPLHFFYQRQGLPLPLHRRGPHRPLRFSLGARRGARRLARRRRARDRPARQGRRRRQPGRGAVQRRADPADEELLPHATWRRRRSCSCAIACCRARSIATRTGAPRRGSRRARRRRARAAGARAHRSSARLLLRRRRRRRRRADGAADAVVLRRGPAWRSRRSLVRKILLPRSTARRARAASSRWRPTCTRRIRRATRASAAPSAPRCSTVRPATRTSFSSTACTTASTSCASRRARRRRCWCARSSPLPALARRHRRAGQAVPRARHQPRAQRRRSGRRRDRCGSSGATRSARASPRRRASASTTPASGRESRGASSTPTRRGCRRS